VGIVALDFHPHISSGMVSINRPGSSGPICGEAIEYERAKLVQWAKLNCEWCGVNLIMEIQGEPKPRYIASRDYIGGSICRCCMEEHCAQTNCLQCEIGKQPDCPYSQLKKTALANKNDN